MIAIFIITTIIQLALGIMVPYFVAKLTKKGGLELSHLVVCAIIFLLFNGLVADMAILYCIFKMIGVGAEPVMIKEYGKEE